MTNLFAPKHSDSYKNLTAGGEYTVKLSQDEACVALKIHISKLKDQIWP